MKTVFIAIVFLLIGGAIGGFLGLGMGSATGVVVGTKAGACLALETAKDQGLLNTEQIDQVIAGAIQKISDKVGESPDDEPSPVASAADCAKVVAELEKAVQSQ